MALSIGFRTGSFLSALPFKLRGLDSCFRRDSHPLFMPAFAGRTLFVPYPIDPPSIRVPKSGQANRKRHSFLLPVVEAAGAIEDEVGNLPAAFTLRLAGLRQSQPRVHLEARGTSGKVRSLCDLPMRASYGPPPERVHLSGRCSQSSPRSFPRNGEY